VKEPVLDDEAVAAALSSADGPRWTLVAGKLVKVVECAGFVGSLAFVGAVGELAEAADHHPDIDIRYNRVTLALMTHDSGGITRLDLDLARAIDSVSAGTAATSSPGRDVP
jgi:4a-hydroxytetrahydrobiopterin dehydratase